MIAVGDKVQVRGSGEIVTVRELRITTDRGQISAALCEGTQGSRWIALMALEPIDATTDANQSGDM